jgi:hypothetical protein
MVAVRGRCRFSVLFSLGFVFCGSRDETWGLEHTKQVLYHCTTVAACKCSILKISVNSKQIIFIQQAFVE